MWKRLIAPLLRRWRSQRELFSRQRERLLEGGRPQYRPELIRLYEEWAERFVFQHFSSARAELTPYRGSYSRITHLLDALARAHSAISKGGEVYVEEIVRDARNEHNLDYFLTTEVNLIFPPAQAVTQLLNFLREINRMLIELEAEEDHRYEYYRLKYSYLLDDATLALDSLILASDLYYDPPQR